MATVYTGYRNNARFYLSWGVAQQDVPNNRSLINWTVGIEASPTAGSYWYSNAIRINSVYVDGQGNLASGTWSDIYMNRGQVVPLRSGSVWVGHNSDGTKVVGASMSGWLYSYGDLGTSGQEGVPTIPRGADPTTDKGSYTLGEPITVYTNRRSDSFTHTVRFEGPGGAIRGDFNSVGSQVTWNLTQTDINTIQSRIPTSNSYPLQIAVWNNQVGEWRHAWRTLYLTNANPIFTNFTYRDSNDAVVTITGNDQILVRGKSTLETTISEANKMVAVKSATPARYSVNFDGVTEQDPYTETGSIVNTFGVTSIGQRTILTTATDSRNNNTTVSKQVTVYDYTAPTIESTITRENNFGDDTTVSLKGSWTPLIIDGTAKNSLTVGTLRYRYKEDGGIFNAWAVRPFTATGSTWAMDADFIVSISNQKKYVFEFEIADRFGVVTSTGSVDVGKPILFVGENNGVPALGIGKMPTNGAIDVVGDIYSNGKKVVVNDMAYVQCWIDGNDTNQGWTGYRRFNTVVGTGITATNNTRFTIVTKGIYYIKFQQLVNTAGAMNYYIQVNGVNKARGWQNAIQKDMTAQWVGELNIGDYVQLWTDVAPNNSWSDTHSSFSMFKLIST